MQQGGIVSSIVCDFVSLFVNLIKHELFRDIIMKEQLSVKMAV